MPKVVRNEERRIRQSDDDTPLASDKCPCCGAMVSKGRFLVDLAANVAIYNGKIWRGQPKSIELLYLLHQAFPRPVPTADLLNKVWGVFSGNVMMSVHVQISTTKRELKKYLGVEIMSTKYEGISGYRLKLPDHEYVPEQRLKLDVALADLPARNRSPSDQIKHGTLTMYFKRGCRCDLCAEYKRAYYRTYMKVRYRRKHPERFGLPTDTPPTKPTR